MNVVFSIGLDKIKESGVSYLKHSQALITTSYLKNNRYEILFLEEVCDKTFIYKAFDSENNHFVTIKEFFPRDALGLQEELYFLRNPMTLAMEIRNTNEYKVNKVKDLVAGFIEEARYLEKISYGDPVLRIIDSFEENQTGYIVSNYNEWPSLQNFIDSDYIFTEEEVEWLFKEIVNHMMRYHKRQIVHRGINPRNIYIKPDELVIDSIGACDYMQDIKILDADSYKCKYYGPEIKMHSGAIGTWTDMFAIGKVMIDIISNMTSTNDYFSGLEELSSKNKDLYKTLISEMVTFNYRSRIENVMILKKRISHVYLMDNSFKTPKLMIAAIAMISFVSSLLFVWQYNNDTMMADDYIILEDEQVPLGAVNIEEDVCTFLISHLAIKEGQPVLLKWINQVPIKISHLEVIDQRANLLSIDLAGDQKEVDLSHYELLVGKYDVRLYYHYENEIKMIQMRLEILE